jgi:hypothetical protein
MKINNKQVLIIFVSVAIVFSAFAYLTKAVQGQTVSGYLVLMDQKVSSTDYSAMGVRNFDVVVYLPSDTSEATVSSCSFTFPDVKSSTDAILMSSSTVEKADVTNDGKIDNVDLYLSSLAFGCASGNSCWSDSYNLYNCYFTYTGGYFEDPTGDCRIDGNDTAYYSPPMNCFGQVTNPSSNACETTPCCRADVNRDGKVDGMDVAILARYYGTYADVYRNYINLKKKDMDINGDTVGVPDGKVDGKDIAFIARNYGAAATEQTCKSIPLEYISGNAWRVKTSGRGLYYVGVAWTGGGGGGARPT